MSSIKTDFYQTTWYTHVTYKNALLYIHTATIGHNVTILLYYMEIIFT